MTMHYHGTPLTPHTVLHSLAGRLFCVPFSDPRNIETCDAIGQGLMLDNGAFSAWRRGYLPDWLAYYTWTDRWLDRPTTWAVVPDVIDGDAAANDTLLDQWPHRRERGAPVWHLHEPIERLLWLLDRWPRVCFGSSGAYAAVGAPAWHGRVTAAWNAIAARHHRTPNIHMLRGMQCVRWGYPFASVDSTDIARNHNRPHDTAARMAQRWDGVQCPRRWVLRSEQMELVA
jgi:hypothetical protein